MSIFSRIREYFTPKVIFVGHSELSKPVTRAHKNPREQELEVLHILYMHGKMKAREIDREYPSGGRRLNELYHKGFVDNLGNRHQMIYKINEAGIEYLTNNHLKGNTNY